MSEYIDLLNKTNKTEFLKELYQTGLMNDVPIITDDSLMVVLSIMKAKNAKRILEIGTAIAYSAISFVSDDEKRIVDTIERNEQMYHEAVKNVKLYDLEKQIRIHFDDALLIDLDKLDKITKILTDMIEYEKDGWLDEENIGPYLCKIEEWLNDK